MNTYAIRRAGRPGPLKTSSRRPNHADTACDENLPPGIEREDDDLCIPDTTPGMVARGRKMIGRITLALALILNGAASIAGVSMIIEAGGWNNDLLGFGIALVLLAVLNIGLHAVPRTTDRDTLIGLWIRVRKRRLRHELESD